MATPVDSGPAAFQWEPQPEASQFVRGLVADALGSSGPAQRLAERMLNETGTRLVDFVDHLGLAASDANEQRLVSLGFELDETAGHPAWRHPGGLFPAIYLYDQHDGGLAIRVESVADFLLAQDLEWAHIEGEPLAAVRKAKLPLSKLWAVERHGSRGLNADPPSGKQLQAILHYAEAFRRRIRHYVEAEEGFAETQALVAHAVTDIGVDRTCELFFAGEREYWQRRNRAGQVQRARQDRLGLGWANHDHHTYRSSRQHFTRLVALLEQLGFECRERFYGGREAGWGAQVLEQPQAGVVIFADVDLSPEEVAGDFAHQPLPPQDRLGTVGLWCQLHGEAILEAGMHHLECQFDFDRAREQLRGAGVESMKPFTDFPYLRQSFTKADLWHVAPQRIDSALAAGLISREQADQFRTQGALGSHLEILERNDGYKGFNQTGISEIILETDPRRKREG